MSELPEGYVRPKKKIRHRGRIFTKIKGWQRVQWDRWTPKYISQLLRISVPQVYVYRRRYAPHLSKGYWQRMFTKHPCLLHLDNKLLAEKLGIAPSQAVRLRKEFGVTEQNKLQRGRPPGQTRIQKLAQENPEMLKLDPAILAKEWGCAKRTIYNVRKRYLSAEQDGDGGTVEPTESAATDGGGSGDGSLIVSDTGPTQDSGV